MESLVLRKFADRRLPEVEIDPGAGSIILHYHRTHPD